MRLGARSSAVILLVLLLGVATCRDDPAGADRARAILSIAPVLPASAAQLDAFALTIDNVRLIVVRPPSSVVLDETYPLAPDQTTLQISETIDLQSSPETFEVTVEYRSGATVLFSGTTTVQLTSGAPTQPEEIPVTYAGPGQNVATLAITPLDTTATFGATVPYAVTARDGQGAPVLDFYVAWSTSDPTVPIDALGRLTAGSQRQTVTVTARTPTDVTASTPLTLQPAPSAVTVMSGNGQQVSPAAVLALPLRVQVVGPDQLGVRGVAVNFVATGGGGSVATPQVVTDAQGFAQTGATAGPIPGPNTFTASVAGVATPATFTATVVAAQATQLAFTAQPGNRTAGTALGPVTIELRDAQGQLVSSATNAVTIALGANPGGATLGGTTTVSAVGGVATFSDLGLTRAAVGYTLAASAAGLTGATSSAFTITAAAPAQLVYTMQPSDAVAGLAIAPAMQVEVRDQFGNLVATATNTVTLAIQNNPGGATLGGTTSAAAVSGVVTLGTVSLDRSGSGYTLVANAAGLTGAISAAFNIVPAAASRLAITSHPASAVAGQPFSSPVVVEAQDAFGNLQPAFTGTVALAIGTNPSGGTLSGTTSTAATGGGASFAGLGIDNPGNGYTLVASGGGLSPGTSGPIDVTAPAGTRVWINAAGGNWSNPANWSGNAVPAINEIASITVAGTYTVTVDVNDTVASVVIGAASGAQTLAMNGRTVGMTAGATIGAAAVVDATNSALTGPAGTITNNGTLRLQNTSVQPALMNNALMVARSNTAFTGAVTTGTGAIFRVEGDAFCCAASVTVASGFTNAGLVELTAINGSGTTAALTVTSGTLVNAGTGTIASLPGAGGARTLAATVNNQGAFTIDQPLTWNGGAGASANSGTLTVNQALTHNQTGSLGTTGMIVVAASQTWTVSGGTLTYTSGNLGGLGTVAVSGATLGLGQSLTNDTLTLTLTNSTVNGPGTLGNASGRTLVVQNTMVNAPLNLQGLLRARSNTAFTGAVTTGTGAIFRVEGDAFCCAASVTVASGFTNAGLVELTAINASGTTAALTVTSGTLVNAGTGTIASLPGAGGARTLTATVNNQGAFTIDQPLTWNGGAGASANSGTLTVNQALTHNQTGSLGTTGMIVVAASQTWTVSGGTLTYTSGNLGGLGTVAVSGATLGLGQSLTNDTLTLTLTNSTVNGPGTLGNASGRTLVVQNTMVNAPLNLQGLLRARSNTAFTGAVTTGTGAIFRVEGDAFCCAASVTVASGFTNAGLVELTAINASGTTAALTVTSGTLVNAGTGTIASLPGAGGARTLAATVNNQGAFTIDQPLTWNGGAGASANSGTLTVNQALTHNQTGSLGTTGMIVVAASQTWTVSGGTLTYTSGNLGGLGTVAVSGATLGLGQSLTNDTLTLTLTNSTVNGPGTLGNASGRTLVVQNTMVNAPLNLQGLLRARSNTAFTGAVTTGTGAIFRVEGDAFCCAASVTVASGFTNAG